MDDIRINLNELLLSFSLLLDVAENRPFQHAKRVAYIALQVINKLEKKELLDLTFQAAILHDIGVTHSILLHGHEEFHKAETIFAASHTSTGYEIVKELPFGNNIAEIIRYHHERWDGMGPERLQGNGIPYIAQIIALADHIELKYDRRKDSISYRDEFRSWLQAEKGKAFNGDLVDVVLTLFEQEKLWLDLSVYDISPLLMPLIPDQSVYINIDELEQIAKAFAVIIDKKSAFTHRHSLMVSQRAFQMAEEFGYGDIKCRKMKIAGYLHDIGKLIVPNSILDKPDKLTKDEMLAIKKHPYYSKFILRQIKGFEEISEWGPNHHENLLGTGYPEGLSGEAFTEESQIMAICDIYQALTENRIYRTGMPPHEAVKILSKLVDKGYYERYIFDRFLKTNCLL
ncbi:MAG: HD domain-containing phosphohydrolase [Bacillota bacterium]